MVLEAQDVDLSYRGWVDTSTVYAEASIHDKSADDDTSTAVFAAADLNATLRARTDPRDLDQDPCSGTRWTHRRTAAQRICHARTSPATFQRGRCARPCGLCSRSTRQQCSSFSHCFRGKTGRQLSSRAFHSVRPSYRWRNARLSPADKVQPGVEVPRRTRPCRWRIDRAGMAST